jgi:D-3-phosphoglycerate dehydrogenase
MSDRPRVLVKEKIADTGVELLRQQFDVDLGLDMDDAELAQEIGKYDAILIRSATRLTPELIARADRMKVIGRAGTGVDNVDIPAATKRGIIVANAPESNSVAAAEHTLALALALFRNVPQAHGSLVAGRWDRALFKGSELYGKTLGVIGFGRIGQLVAKRAQAFEMEVLAFDKFVSAERFKDLGVEGVETVEELYGRADLLTVHLPKTPETIDWIDAGAIAAMKPGMRIVNCARGELIDLDALVDGLDSGQVKGAALDVFPDEPFTDHAIFSRPEIVVTPHLGASTSEAQDRAGTDTAEQVTAALTGGIVTNAVNIASVSPAEMEALAPFVPLCQTLGQVAAGLTPGIIDRVDADFRGGVAAHDSRLLTVAVQAGLLAGHTAEAVNLVNAPQLAEERGIEVNVSKEPGAEDFTDLIRVSIHSQGETISVGGTTVGPKSIPYLVSIQDQSFYLPFAAHMAVFRYSDQPGMIGRVGSILGEQGVNIGSAAVGAESHGDQAVMVVTSDAAVSAETVARITETDGFSAGYSIEL